MIAALAFLLSFAGLSAALEKLTASRTHSGALLAVCLIILMHFFAGVGEIPLASASQFLIGCSIAGWVYLCIPLREKRIALFSVAMIVLAGAALHFRLAGAYLTAWDDFSHWGVIAKELFYHGLLTHLYTETAVIFTDYPPGSALFYFYVMQFTGYSEGALFFAHGLMLLALTLAVVPVEKGAYAGKLLGVALVWLSFCLNADAYRSLFVDGILGGLFGAALVIFYAERANTRKAVLLLTPLLLVLPLIKMSGFSFVWFIAGFIGAVLLRYVRQYWAALVLLAGALAGAFAVRGLWKWWLGDMPNPMARRAYSFSTLLRDLGTPELTEKYEKTLQNFSAKAPALFWSDGGLLLLITIGLSLFVARRATKTGWSRVAIVQMGLFTGFLVYAAGLLLLYLTSFSTKESIALASHERYLLTYFVGWSLVSIHLALALLPSFTGHHRRLGKALPMLLVVSVAALFHWLPVPAKEPDTDRQRIRAEKEMILPLLSRNERVFFLWDGYTSLDCFKANYEFVPYYPQLREYCSTYERPYPERIRIPEDYDRILPQVPINERGEEPLPDGFDWLFIPRGDAHMVKIIGRHFSTPDDLLRHQLFYKRQGRFWPQE